MGMSRGREKSFLRLFLCLIEMRSEICVFLCNLFLALKFESYGLGYNNILQFACEKVSRCYTGGKLIPPFAFLGKWVHLKI